MAAAMVSPAVKRLKPASLPTASVARPEPLSRKAHSSSGSWLPPTIGAGSGRVMPAGRVTLEASQWSSSALGNSQRPVTLVQGTVPSATIS